jgi:hypothetical protein
MEAFETFEHAGFVCELHYDEAAPSPADWDQLGTVYQFGRAWLQGAESASGDIEEAHERNRPGLVVRALRMAGETAVLFQFQDYGSGGSRILALDDGEDDRATGYISTTDARGRELGIPEKDGEAERQLRGELKDWDAWVCGEVVGYVVREDVKTSNGADVGEVVHSVWGFYPERDVDGSDGYEYVRQEARDAAESERDSRAERARVAAAGWAMAHGQTVTA